MMEKEEIRAEIERRLKGLLDGCVGQRFAYQSLLSFIDSLQEEPVSEGLDEAASNYSEEHRIALMDYETGEIEMNKSLDILNAFKAGAEWGKNQAMAEIQAQSMALAHVCPKEPVSEDLKNAADNALESISDKYDIISVGSCLEMFRLGTEWQKSKMEE